MSKSESPIPVALEIGQKRVFASAIAWPGWARAGKDEASALAALLAYGPRYQSAIRSARLGFRAPQDTSAFEIVERLAGDTTTDFGAPGIAPAADSAPVDTSTLKQLVSILNACWATFESTVESANGKQLRKGPRGGGRSAAQLVDHVVESHYSYLRNIYWRRAHEKTHDVSDMLKAVKQADADALAFAASGDMPKTGPRGGKLWQPRYFVRRAAWHILDHAWEIEDKIE